MASFCPPHTKSTEKTDDIPKEGESPVKTPSTAELEASILQQLFYQIPEENIRFSRFLRKTKISNISKWIKFFVIICSLISIFSLAQKGNLTKYLGYISTKLDITDDNRFGAIAVWSLVLIFILSLITIGRKSHRYITKKWSNRQKKSIQIFTYTMEVLSFAGLLSIMVNIPILKTLLYAGIKASFILFPFLIILCSFYYLFEMIYIGIYKGHWKKLELKLGKIQSEHQVSGSIINENIHDILVLFHNADLDVVVFEDIDRLSNAMDIFTKLRELNETINRSHEIKNEGKKVMFMYALNDNIIPESEERTKFFDLIMPLYPIISHINKVDMVYNELNKFNIELKESLSSKFISKIAPFIEDIRLLKNICNEYAIYQKLFFLNTSIENHIGKVELSEKIFTLITLKIFFPEHFYNRNKKDGLLQSIFVETKNKLKEGATKVLKDLSSDNDFQHLNSEEAFISMDDIKGSMTLHELIKNGYYNHERLSKYIPNNKITTTKLKDFIITIIKNGYLDEFYDLYLSNKTSELTKNDQLFVQLQNTNYDIPIDYRLDSPIDVMEFINKNKVSNPLNLLNYSLLSYDDNNKDYYTINPLTIIYEFIHSYESLRYKFNVTTQVLQIGFNRQKLQTR
ncbi:hypothetical protein K5X82_00180 [Halosquirtibacter xylanolyticus]|nr:hypothetical protein K5X82_00180 [Prolixibacteraceae bacterium]